jgi:hypothetical protein
MPHQTGLSGHTFDRLFGENGQYLNERYRLISPTICKFAKVTRSAK